MTASAADVFRTTTVKVTLPPGDCTDVGLAVFSRASEEATSVSVTVASSWSLTSSPSSSWPAAVTTSVFSSPALPVTVRVNLQV